MITGKELLIVIFVAIIISLIIYYSGTTLYFKCKWAKFYIGEQPKDW